MPIAPRQGFRWSLGLTLMAVGGGGDQHSPALPTLPSPLQKHWPPGTQCVTKHDHTKPKAQELAFHKGDVVTIIEAVEVSLEGAQGPSALGGHAGEGTPVPSAELLEPAPRHPFP